MSKYFIHTCEQRMHYVLNVLVPTLYDQGIAISDMSFYNGSNGNLKDFMKSCEICLETFGGEEHVWHLQDDVYPCSDFKARTEQAYDADIVCGFTCDYGDNTTPTGKHKVNTGNMWWSFPCIQIPNSILKHMVEWQNPHLWRNPYFREYVMLNRGDDLVFRHFTEYYYPNMTVLNLAPNLVEHVDYLLGGSVVNSTRKMDTRSAFWEEHDRIEKLEKLLRGH